MLTKCYNPQLGSGCSLDKDLSKNKGDDQLVKCKATELYPQLYILLGQLSKVHRVLENLQSLEKPKIYWNN